MWKIDTVQQLVRGDPKRCAIDCSRDDGRWGGITLRATGGLPGQEVLAELHPRLRGCAPPTLGVYAEPVPAVARAAMESGVATRPIADFDAYEERLGRFVFRSGLVMKPIIDATDRGWPAIHRAATDPIRASGTDPMMIRAQTADL